MADKLDYKKEYKDLYLPGRKPVQIDVPEMKFIQVDGQGEPGGEAYQEALQLLYALSFTIKMSKMGKEPIEGYFDYVVPPLEGLWWSGDGGLDLDSPRSEWRWTSMIRQPEFVTEEVFQWAADQCRAKKPELNVAKARFVSFREGLCVQMMHTGPYAEEKRTIGEILAYIRERGLIDASGTERKHHEIYLSDPRRTAPEKLKTVLRLPVEEIR